MSKSPMKVRVRIEYQSGQTRYLSGFDNTGQPITGIKGTAHEYPEWAATQAARNAMNALGSSIKAAICEVAR